MPLPIINNSDWDLPPRVDRVFSIRVSRNTLIALLASIALHLALLWIFAPKLFSMGVPIKDSPPFEVSLGPPQKKEVANSEPVLSSPQESTAEPVKEQVPEPSKPKTKKIIKQKSAPPKQVKPEEVPVEVAKKSDLTVPKVPEKATVPEAETSPDPLPGEDMQTYIKRQKEAKLAEKGYSKQDVEEVLASNNPQSAGEKRDAKINENLKFDGTNGIFEIRGEIGLHNAQFSFKGWKTNVNTARLEIIDVDIPDGADGRREVIKKMIEIIRREYSGDFNWESRRLGRVLVLSARLQDNDALEDFMLMEFFGSGTRQR